MDPSPVHPKAQDALDKGAKFSYLADLGWAPGYTESYAPKWTKGRATIYLDYFGKFVCLIDLGPVQATSGHRGLLDPLTAFNRALEEAKSIKEWIVGVVDEVHATCL